MNPNKIVRTEFASNDYLIYKLVKVVGTRKPRVVKVFGYGLKNRLWVKILGFNGPVTTFLPELAVDAKSSIASWSR